MLGVFSMHTFLPDELFCDADKEDIAFLVVGDPFGFVSPHFKLIDLHVLSFFHLISLTKKLRSLVVKVYLLLGPQHIPTWFYELCKKEFNIR